MTGFKHLSAVPVLSSNLGTQRSRFYNCVFAHFFSMGIEELASAMSAARRQGGK